MNIIVDRPQLVRVVKLYLTKFFGDLTPKTSSKYPDLVFYVNSDNEIFMQYNKKNEYIWISYNKIWLKLELYFPLKYNDIQLIMKDWLEEHYNLRVATALEKYSSYPVLLEEHYNLRGTTPSQI